MKTVKKNVMKNEMKNETKQSWADSGTTMQLTFDCIKFHEAAPECLMAEGENNFVLLLSDNS